MTCPTKQALTAKQAFYRVIGSTTTMHKVHCDNLWDALERANLEIKLKQPRENENE